MRIEGRTVLVTGGSRGIGLELVRAFASRGARVASCSRSDRGPAALEAFGERVRHFRCDLSDADDVLAFPAPLRRAFAPPPAASSRTPPSPAG